MYDEALTTEALYLADGADIHNVAGLVATYRSVAREGLDAGELERELRRYVACKRMGRLVIVNWPTLSATACH
ncbi:MAG TPA: hypothetical protein VFE46_02380 [Pirellulales bacterium]|jgi:hypothetical protein|nr:hypothetical protein [Pirellulales bacterium]